MELLELPAELLIGLQSGDAVEVGEEVRAASDVLLSVSREVGGTAARYRRCAVAPAIRLEMPKSQ